GKYALEVVVPLLSRGAQLGALLCFLGQMTNGFQVIYIYAVANSLEAAASIFGARGYYPTGLRSLRKTRWGELIKSGIPYALSTFFVMAALNFDSVLLGRYSYEYVGSYTAGTRIIMVLNV